jgi:hypothetical protein
LPLDAYCRAMYLHDAFELANTLLTQMSPQHG